MTKHRIWRTIACFSLMGCNNINWPEENYVDSLRVLGVKAEPASVGPGESTKLTLLCGSGARGGASTPDCNVEVAWFADCANPPENNPTHCFSHYQTLFKSPGLRLSDAEASKDSVFKISPTYELTMPSTILKNRVTFAGKTVRYGTSYVYYAVCDGTFYSAGPSKERLPVECRDRHTGEKLDQSRFVVGRTTIYSYDVIKNTNPIIERFYFDETTVPLVKCRENQDCGNNFECHEEGVCAPVVAPCNPQNPSACIPHALALQVTRDSFYPKTLDDTVIYSVEKSVWVTYYTNAGNTPTESTYGLAPQTDSQFHPNLANAFWRAPNYSTNQAYLWFVVRDDRGGQAWHVQPIIVR